jgi:hypothetical protein
VELVGQLPSVFTEDWTIPSSFIWTCYTVAYVQTVRWSAFMETDDIYTAGLIDGEGTITLTHKRNNQFRSPCVSVSSTTLELVQFLEKTYGGSISKHKVYRDHHKQSYSWKVHYNQAISFLTKVTPYLKEPEKLRRANLILTGYKSVTKRNGKYSSDELEAKLAFEDVFFHPSTP